AEPAKSIKNVIYGPHDRHRMDVYLPADASNAPVIFMVHGGGWRHGDKAGRHITKNKISRWVNKGIIFVSTNYRVLPEADPLQQAEDIARAISKAQKFAPNWGGDPDKFVLLGHSAGAHLVMLVSASSEMATRIGARPWLGVVAMDSAAMDVPAVMQRKHLRLYDEAFGSDPTYWKKASPTHQLSRTTPPVLAICSLNRKDKPCDENLSMQKQALELGLRVEVLQQTMSHGEINERLGADEPYTAAVEAFMSSLDPQLAALLAQ
ncbi:MAG: alpha/beta hydrolase, partial [Nitrosomonadales bacterium]|nr:alpha/beta hydrolase [Nitrosomonadales bacterium]